jgi:CDP-paratose 2-epimerase
MRILITGICGFVGSTLVEAWRQGGSPHTLIGLDNMIRPGSEINRARLRSWDVPLVHGDLRCPSDLDALPPVDWVIDAAANPSVLAGLDGKSSSRQLLEHNLVGTINLLEYCRRHRAGLILISTSRVYSIAPLSAIAVRAVNDAFAPSDAAAFPPGFTAAGIAEDFSTTPPLSLYGASKAACETLALEYGCSFGFPVWINRCGVLAGPGQFGHAEQGIFSFWLHAWRARRPLKYIGFGGQGHQVRDLLHPRDLIDVFDRQMNDSGPSASRVFNLAGGAGQCMSLRQLSQWCAARWGEHAVQSQPQPRPFDLPWVVLDSARAKERWGFEPRTRGPQILDEIAAFAEQNPQWLDLSHQPVVRA